MEVTRYLFQSTSTSQVQIGTPDPSVKQEAKAKEQTEQLAKDTNTALQKADTFIATQTKPIAPQVDTVQRTESAKQAEPVVAVQEIKVLKETDSNEEIKETNSDSDDSKKSRNIWDRDGNNFENIWSRRSNNVNNIWAGSSTGNFSNIWLKNNDDIKIDDIKDKFDFSKFSKFLDFFA